MSHLELTIRRARRRLWINRISAGLFLCLGIVTLIFGVLLLVGRLYDFRLPYWWIGSVMVAVGAAVAFISALPGTITAESAAASLDQSAGLRERISSAWYCRQSGDPFAQAVVAGAEELSSSLHVPKHVPWERPKRWWLPAVGIALACATFLISPGMLKSEASKATDDLAAHTQETRTVVQKKLREVKQLAEGTEALDELKADLGNLDAIPAAQLEKPGQIRHEAVKKLDKLEDVIRAKRSADQFESMPQLQKMLRGLQVPQSSEAPTDKLAQALRDGDFKTAKDEVQAIKDQLATLKSDSDKELVQKTAQQLDQLAKQLEKLASNQELAKQLAKAGIDEETAKRLLERLSKQDLDQIKKQLEESGLNKAQAEKLANQLQSKQQAGQKGQELAQALKQAAKGMAGGQAGAEAQSGLSDAAQQLSELEMLEQEMNQLESAMAAVQSARQDIGKGGRGNQPGDKPGDSPRGMGEQMGIGRGGIAPTEQTSTAFKTERAKVQTTKGAIVGQFLVDGEQVRGQASKAIEDVVSAAERDASDLVYRDRIPRQYHKAVRNYFKTMQDAVKAKPGSEQPVEKKPSNTQDSPKETAPPKGD